MVSAWCIYIYIDNLLLQRTSTCSCNSGQVGEYEEAIKTRKGTMIIDWKKYI